MRRDVYGYLGVRKIYDWVQSIRTKGHTPVFLYHSVEDAVSHRQSPLFVDNTHNICPELFERQIGILTRYFRIIPLDELAQRIGEGIETKGLASITFDDCHRSVLENALPVLTAHRVPATLFVSTKLMEEGACWRDKVRFLISAGLVEAFLDFLAVNGGDLGHLSERSFYQETKNLPFVRTDHVESAIDEFLDGKGISVDWGDVYCTSEDLKSFASEDISVGNHSHSHYRLSGLELSCQRQEIELCRHKIEALDVNISDFFAIPFGGVTSYDDNTLIALKELGYRGFLTSGSRYRPRCFDSSKTSGLLRMDRYLVVNHECFL